MGKKYRAFSLGFKQGIAERIVNGESVSALHREFQIKRSVLYRWRDAYRKDGAAGLQRRVGRPPGILSPRSGVSPEQAAARRMAELERKIGQQTVELDFFARALRHIKASAPPSDGHGAGASSP